MAGYRGRTRDCVCRAVAIATGRPYFQVYTELSHVNEATGRQSFSARNGIICRSRSFEEYIKSQGFEHCAYSGDLPMGTLLVRVRGHMFAMIDHVAYDTADPSKYMRIEGYWRKT